MSEVTPAVDDILAALADPTRRDLFEAVARSGPVTATQLAADRPITRQAVTKHLERLAASGLARSERAGRQTLWTAETAPLGAAVEWMSRIGDAWDDRLTRLTERFDGRS